MNLTPFSGDLEERLGKLREAEKRAWWRDLTGLVRENDRQLAVIGPRADATAEDLRTLGRALQRWQAEFPPARHIWGLSDLLEGRGPRTPPIYLMVPQSLEGFEESYEPVALVYVADGADTRSTMDELSRRLEGFRGMLAWFERPDAYSYYRR